MTDFKKYTDLVYKIIGAAMKVHSEMNWGLQVSKGLVQDDPSFQSGSDVPVPLTLRLFFSSLQFCILSLSCVFTLPATR